MMQFHHRRNDDGRLKKGFSLVEVLVYLAIFLVVSVASVGFMFSLHDLVGQYRLETVLYRSGSGVLEQILVAVRQADQVDTLSTVEDDPLAGVLAVENAATSTTFTLNAGALDLSINGVDYGNLISEKVVVDGFTVYYYPLSDGREFVRVKLELTGSISPTVSKSITLYGGAVVRGAI